VEFQAFVAEDQFYLIPKKGLSQEQRKQFRELLRPHVTA
jgi:hypothetical protein